MKDLSTGKTYLTKRTKQIAGPAFARAGYNVEHLHGEREIMRAWAGTLTDEQAQCLLDYLEGAAAGPNLSRPASTSAEPA